MRRFINTLSEQLQGSRRRDAVLLGLVLHVEGGIKAEAGKQAQTLP